MKKETEPGGSPIQYIGDKESKRLSRKISNHLKSVGIMTPDGKIKIRRFSSSK